jgi:hypothetical protein
MTIETILNSDMSVAYITDCATSPVKIDGFCFMFKVSIEELYHSHPVGLGICRLHTGKNYLILTLSRKCRQLKQLTSSARETTLKVAGAGSRAAPAR